MVSKALARSLLFLLCLLFTKSGSSPIRRQNDQCQHTQVLVLGGGIAGVTAAHTLVDNAITDFVIVEYNGDLGGRVAHTTFGEEPDGTPYVVELGANWAQGLQTEDGPANPIVGLFHLDRSTMSKSRHVSLTNGRRSSQSIPLQVLTWI